MTKIKVVIVINVETDVGSWTPSYNGVEKGIPALLELFKKQAVRATFFFTGESAERFPEKTKEVLKAGHEVGCHSLYHETIGEEIFPIPGVKPLLAKEIPFRLKKATEVVAKAAGVKMFSFRGHPGSGAAPPWSTLWKTWDTKRTPHILFSITANNSFPTTPDAPTGSNKGKVRSLRYPALPTSPERAKTLTEETWTNGRFFEQRAP